VDCLPDLAVITTHIYASLRKKADLFCAINIDSATDFKVINGVETERLLRTVDVLPCANIRFEFPPLESFESLSDVSQLCGLIDHKDTIVITGYSEAGPWGNSCTHWEMGARGEFTTEGCMVDGLHQVL